MVSTLADCVEALTVTGRRLAEMTKARGYFSRHMTKRVIPRGRARAKARIVPFKFTEREV